MSSTGDIRLVWSNAAGGSDVQVELNDLSVDDGLRTAVLLSLFHDRRAEETDVLPDAGTDRRGWWADSLAEISGDRIGSLLWLLSRSKNLQEALSRAEEYSREALRWLLEDKVAERVEVSAAAASGNKLELLVEVYRPHQKEPTSFRFESPWTAEMARAAGVT